MKRILFLLSGCLLSVAAFAQDRSYQDYNADVLKRIRDTTSKHWHRLGGLSINTSQVSLSNWAAGGENAIAGDAAFNYSFDYKRNRSMWLNRVELGYGISKTKSKGARKSSDRIYYNSLYGYEVVRHWYASFFLNFQTQFAKGYNYSMSEPLYISRFMAPGYLSLGPGVTWMPKDWFIASLSPASWRGTFVMDNVLSAQGAYGVKPGKHFYSGFGADLKLVARFDPLKNISVYTRLGLFSDYLHKPQNIDVRWDTQVTMRVNKWFSANLTFNILYDDDVRFVRKKGGSPVPKTQIKEVLGIGFLAAF